MIPHDVFIRGLAVPKNYIYFGTSWGIGKNKFKIY